LLQTIWQRRIQFHAQSYAFEYSKSCSLLFQHCAQSYAQKDKTRAIVLRRINVAAAMFLQKIIILRPEKADTSAVAVLKMCRTDKWGPTVVTPAATPTGNNTIMYRCTLLYYYTAQYTYPPFTEQHLHPR